MPGCCTQICVAAVQAAPEYLSLKATIDKTCLIVNEAAVKGAKLIAFPEAFLTVVQSSMGLEMPGSAIKQICECAKKNNIYLCLPCIEEDNSSLYSTQLWFNPLGDLMGKHRKYHYSYADNIPCFETDIGNIGGLICSENIEPIYIDALSAMKEEIHVASWLGLYNGSENKMNQNKCLAASIIYAIVTGSFVIMSSQIYSQEILSSINNRHNAIDLEFGGTCIINPNGKIISKQIPWNKEGISFANVNLKEFKKPNIHKNYIY